MSGDESLQLRKPSEPDKRDSEEADIKRFRIRLAESKDFGEVYEIVKETTKRSLGAYRIGLMLYLDDCLCS